MYRGNLCHIIISFQQNFYSIFLYSHTLSGNHICRQSLSGDAGFPGASDRNIFIPLWEKPVIEVFTLRGVHVKTLGAEELLLPQAAEGYAVSDVVDDTLHVWLLSPSEHQIHSYKVSEKMSRKNQR